MLLQEDRVMATGNMHKKLIKFGCIVFQVMQADRLTNEQTYSSQYFVLLKRGQSNDSSGLFFPD